MKKLTLNECASISSKHQKPVPADRKLWITVNQLSKGSSNSKIIEVYEKMGGRWKLLEFKSLQKTNDNENLDLEEEVDLGPLAGHKDKTQTKRWLQRLKACDPDAYEKFLNWD